MWGMGRKGWPLSAGALTPGELNNVYSHGKFFIPAGALVPSDTKPMPYDTYQSSNGSNGPTYGVREMVHDAKSEAAFLWCFKADFTEAPAANLDLKIAPIWFAKSTASAPNNKIRFQAGAINMAIGDSVNQPANPEANIDNIVPATAHDLAAGITANQQAVPLATVTNVTAISPTNWNILWCNIEREALDSEDTFQASIFLLGLGVEFAVDFDNLAAWPTS